MTIGSDEERIDVRDAVDALTDLLLAEEPLQTVLDRIVLLARDGIGECDAASVTWIHDEMFETVACSDLVAKEIDQTQYDTDRGPCLFAYRRREIASIPSMADGDSWPDFRAAALADGMSSSLSLPVAAGDTRVAALNLYARTDRGFESIPPESALRFAEQAAIAILTARTNDGMRDLIAHLRFALENRETIGIAIGIVMANDRVKKDEAFERLRVASQHRNVKLRDLAQEVVETGETPSRD